MLNHLLAVIMELGGLSLFLSGFFFPEVRRKSDFAWSGVALLYALVLWIEGDSTSGGALLGHIASVALILWFGWQALTQRRQFAPPEDQTAIPGSLETLKPFLKDGWAQIMVAYGETSAWVQNQLAKEDSGTLPEMQIPSTPLQDASDENSEASSTSLPGKTSETRPTEPIAEEVGEAIATHPESTIHEVPVEIPPIAEMLESETDIELNQAQEPPEIVPNPILSQAEPEEIQSPIVLEEQTSSDSEHPVAPTTVEPDNSPQKEIVAEATSVPEAEQNNPNTEEAEEKTNRSTLEDDDESWPPKDLT